MTLNFQNKIVFPAPESSYSTQSSFGQVIYIPRKPESAEIRALVGRDLESLSSLSSAKAHKASSVGEPKEEEEIKNQDMEVEEQKSPEKPEVHSPTHSDSPKSEKPFPELDGGSNID